MNKPVLLAVTAALAVGCPKRLSTTLAGTDEEQLDQYSAQLEEMRSNVQASEPKCGDWCSMATRVCDLSKNVCEIAKRHVDRNDAQRRCVASQEDCARFNDSCGSCQRSSRARNPLGPIPTRIALATLLLAVPPLAGNLDPQKVAKIQREQKQAMDEVDKQHGNKKASEMSSVERKEVIRAQADAQRAVLEKNGVEAKDLARYTAKMSRSERAQAQAADKELEKKETADKVAAAQKPAEIKIQRGFSNKAPVELEAKDEAPPVVEHGLPAEGN